MHFAFSVTITVTLRAHFEKTHGTSNAKGSLLRDSATATTAESPGGLGHSV